MKVLLLEDDQLFGESIEEFLSENGFHVVWVKSGKAAIDVTYKTLFDVMVFDVNLPDMSGFDVLKHLRGAGNTTPTLFLTSRNTDADTMAGFDVGCDDFLKKPCSLQELHIRIKARIRGKFGQTQSMIPLKNGIVFNIDEGCVVKEGECVEMNPKELALLKLLITHKGKTVSSAMIEQELYPSSQEASYGAIRVYIANLKKIIGEENLENIRGVGYRLG